MRMYIPNLIQHSNQLINQATNSTGQRCSSDVNNHTASENLSCNLTDRKCPSSSWQTSTTGPYPCEMNPVHIHTHFLTLHFNIIFLFITRFLKLFSFPIKFRFYTYFSSVIVGHCLHSYLCVASSFHFELSPDRGSRLLNETSCPTFSWSSAVHNV